MTSTPAFLRFCCASFGLIILTGCGERTVVDGRAARVAGEDAASPALDGLTPEQIEQRAEAMAPEQAEQLGVIDTTIRVANEP